VCVIVFCSNHCTYWRASKVDSKTKTANKFSEWRDVIVGDMTWWCWQLVACFSSVNLLLPRLCFTGRCQLLFESRCLSRSFTRPIYKLAVVTVVGRLSPKNYHFIILSNFVKPWPIFKILSLRERVQNLLECHVISSITSKVCAYITLGTKKFKFAANLVENANKCIDF